MPALALLLITILLLLQARPLNALLTGEEGTTSLSINLARFRLQLFVLTSLLVGTAVAVSGAIGFMGLMIPHIVRMFVGANHRRLLPLVALGGAGYLMLVDLLGRTLIAPEEIFATLKHCKRLQGQSLTWLLNKSRGSPVLQAINMHWQLLPMNGSVECALSMVLQ